MGALGPPLAILWDPSGRPGALSAALGRPSNLIENWKPRCVEFFAKHSNAKFLVTHLRVLLAVAAVPAKWWHEVLFRPLIHCAGGRDDASFANSLKLCFQGALIHTNCILSHTNLFQGFLKQAHGRMHLRMKVLGLLVQQLDDSRGALRQSNFGKLYLGSVWLYQVTEEGPSLTQPDMFFISVGSSTHQRTGNSRAA